MSLDYTIIGERLKKAREAKKLTQQELAEQIDMSVAFLSKIECGKTHINLTRLNQICSILGTTEGQILNGASSTGPNTYLTKDFADLFQDCPPEKLKLIYKIAKVVAED